MRGKPLSAYVLICEKVLQESDRVNSAIRIVDIFYYNKALDEIAESKRVIAMAVIGAFRVPAEDDESHALRLDLVRPSGEATTFVDMEMIRPESEPRKAPDSPGGYSLATQVGVVARELGVHYVRMYVDGEEAASAAFTIMRPAEDEKPS